MSITPAHESIGTHVKSRRVELVAGPRCGDVVNWPGDTHQLHIAYHAGTAVYRYEGNGKAVYVGG